MAINPHDDYEALAKLLYPSIEASGNVYYGQTRKLAVDELFDKNNGGFESYFCSCKKEDGSSQYEQHFHWKLGPFSDTVKIVDDTDDKTYKDYPLAWLKYRLIKRESNNSSIINNASYNIYDVDYILDQPTLHCPLDGTLPNGNMYNNSNFFLDKNAKILYVLLYKAPVYEDMDKPLYIEALTDDIRVRLVRSETQMWSDEQIAQCKYKYGFDYNNLTIDLQLDTEITISKGNRIYVKCEDRSEFDDSIYVQFIITSDNENAEVAIGGNVESMAKFENENGDMLDYAYSSLFFQNNLITDVSRLYIGKLSNHSCDYLFSDCARLKTAPAILPCLELKQFCYHFMFSDCATLENAPILPAKDGTFFCYAHMFSDLLYESSKLREIKCLLKTHNDEYTYQWLDGRTGVEYITVLANSGWESATSDTIPYGCQLEVIDSTIHLSDDISVSNTPIEKCLITHGTNNENNGRGDITDPSTLANMEKSFDENNSHQMNTYNTDGSFNQEVWGYKSFCSPVQFRNGIYTDTLSILSTYESGTSDYLNLDLNGSIIKSAESEINLINYKLSNGFDADGNMFTVSLAGYATQEKHVECSAELVTVGNYVDDRDAYTCESYISAATDGGRAWSRINANRDNCSADVTALVNRNGAKLSLSASDFDGESHLDILPSKSRFGGNPVTAEKWGLSDIIANTLRGIGYMDNGSACTKYGAVGTLGLFRVNTYFPKAGNIISGDYLSLINIQLNNNSLEVTVDTNETMLGTWAALTPVKENSETNNIILAVRIQ